jgi:hypothetical protein
MVAAVLPFPFHVPENPVKLTFRAELLATPRNERAYVPVVKLKEMLLASVKIPGDTVVLSEPELEMLTVGVPVTVKLVTIAVVQIVTPLVSLHVMLPVPKARVRIELLLELKRPVVIFFPFKFKIPALKVQARVDPIVKSSKSCTVPPTAPSPTEKSKVFAFEVRTCVPDVAKKFKVDAEEVKVIPVEIVKLP